MKYKILILFLLMAGFSAEAQKLIEEKKVPANVKKVLTRKARGATDVKWFQVDKQNYMAKFKENDYPGEIHLTREGKITLIEMEVNPETLPSRIQSELKKNHRDKKLHKAYSVQKGRKDKFYKIILHKKQGRKKPPLVYEVQYTLQGKYITTYTPTPKTEPKDAKPEKTKFGKNVDEEMDELDDKVKDEKIKKKDLPTKAAKYLEDNYDYEYRAKEVYIKHNKKYGQYYYVVMKKQGEKKEFIHFFDFKGDLLKKEVKEL